METIIVGVVNKLTMRAVLMLLGNELAGSKMGTSSHTKSRKPVCFGEMGSDRKHKTARVNSCAVTRAQTSAMNNEKRETMRVL